MRKYPIPGDILSSIAAHQQSRDRFVPLHRLVTLVTMITESWHPPLRLLKKRRSSSCFRGFAHLSLYLSIYLSLSSLED